MQGWISCLQGEPIDEFKLIIGHQEIEQFKVSKNLPSPDVQKLYPTFPNSDQSQFLIDVPLDKIAPQQFHTLVKLW